VMNFPGYSVSIIPDTDEYVLLEKEYWDSSVNKFDFLLTLFDQFPKEVLFHDLAKNQVDAERHNSGGIHRSEFEISCNEWT
jgi:hypothetical protein